MKQICTTCGKRVLQTQAHITIGEDGGYRAVFHLACWLAMPDREKDPR